MSRDRRARIRRRAAATAGLATIAIAGGSALAFQALPPGAQVNDDAAAGINKALSVSGEDPANADVVGGALTAGKVAVPWAIFRQTQASPSHDQIFSRSFANGAWTTRGSGTVNGRSSASPTFAGSLNFDQSQDGEAPSIDFAGAGRTVPWATWYENTTSTDATFNNNNIFASRFDNTGDANQGKWIFAGQSRGNGGSGPNVPSLNIHTNDDAENPSVAGGTTSAGGNPGPWVTWQETDPTADQIFVERPEGPGMTDCTGVTPTGVSNGSIIPAIGGFCWQQVGIPRVGPGTADPSLNVDPSRNGIEPDIAFTGLNDNVPWVVWYETGATTHAGLANQNLVFAAKAVVDTGAGTGGFHWQVVGTLAQGTLDAADSCAATQTAEEQCSINKNPSQNANAEDPQIASGTMTAGQPTAPWIAWDEQISGVQQVFVARAVGTGSAQHFEIVNNGSPISQGSNNSTRADITFDGNTPYVTWREDIGGGLEKVFVGHFTNATTPVFHLDESDVTITPTADVREPISSACTANPFNQDGAACQGGALGTPFFLYTAGTSPLSLFADAYQPDTPVTGAASAITTTSAQVSGTVNPEGAAASVSFEYGTTTNYGSTTAATSVGPDNQSDPFSATLTGLAPGTPIHYRANVTTDFGTIHGPDQTLTTSTAVGPTGPTGTTGTPDGTLSTGRATVAGKTASIRLTCNGSTGQTCAATVQLSIVETLKGRKVIGVAARGRRVKTVIVGSGAATLAAGQSQTVKVSLNGAGARLLATRHKLPAKLAVSQRLRSGQPVAVLSQTVTFKVKRHRGRRGH